MGGIVSNPLDTLKNVGLNLATGGLYGVGKGIAKAASTGKILAGVADAGASIGTFGSVSQPVLGTKNTLLAEGAIAGGAGIGAGLGGAGAAGGAGGVPVSSGVLGATPAVSSGTAGGLTSGQLAAAGLGVSAAGTAYSALKPPPKLPDAAKAFDPTAANQAARAAANAVQSKEAEARRLRRSRSARTALTGPGGLTGAAPTDSAKLLPPPARKSVLG